MTYPLLVKIEKMPNVCKYDFALSETIGVKIHLSWGTLDTDFGVETGFITNNSIIRYIEFYGIKCESLRAVSLLCVGRTLSEIKNTLATVDVDSNVGKFVLVLKQF